MTKTYVTLMAGAAAIAFLTGCETVPPGVERGPHGTIAYDVTIEASEPGARIEANGQNVGNTPVTIKIYGDKDGTFHDFGSYHYEIRAYPLATNQYAQTRFFRTGRAFAGEDHIPKSVYVDMSQPQPTYAPPAGPTYYAPPPDYYYYGPRYYYGSPYYHHGPSFRFHFGSPGHHHRHYR